MKQKFGDDIMDAKDVQGLIRDYIQQYLVMDDGALRLAAAYAQATWVYSRFDVVPPLLISGDAGMGKSRLANVLKAISFNGEGIRGTFKTTLKRLDQIGLTLFVDEADLDREDGARFLKLLNLGQQKGLMWSWHTMRGRSQEVEGFMVFGPKVVVGRTVNGVAGYRLAMTRDVDYITRREVALRPIAGVGAAAEGVVHALFEWHRNPNGLPGTFDELVRNLMLVGIQDDVNELVNILNLGVVGGGGR